MRWKREKRWTETEIKLKDLNWIHWHWHIFSCCKKLLIMPCGWDTFSWNMLIYFADLLGRFCLRSATLMELCNSLEQAPQSQTRQLNRYSPQWDFKHLWDFRRSWEYHKHPLATLFCRLWMVQISWPNNNFHSLQNHRSQSWEDFILLLVYPIPSAQYTHKSTLRHPLQIHSHISYFTKQLIVQQFSGDTWFIGKH